MGGYKKDSNVKYDIKYHVIWLTKYRYKILRGELAVKTKELIWQGCEARGVTILQGSVGKDYIHLLISCPPTLAPSEMMQHLKGNSSRLLQDQFPKLKMKYWNQHLWEREYFCSTIGYVDEEIIRNYITNQFNEEKNDNFRIEE